MTFLEIFVLLYNKYTIKQNRLKDVIDFCICRYHRLDSRICAQEWQRLVEMDLNSAEYLLKMDPVPAEIRGVYGII